MPIDDELTKVLVPALLALLGTILGLWLGHRRWASELQMKKRSAFDARRYEAYTELWNIVENAHITIRTGRPGVSEVQRLEQQINAFRLRNAILLDPSDSERAMSYFTGVVRLSRLIAESGSRTLERRFESTSPFSETDVEAINELTKATDDASKLRDELIARIRQVMLDTSYAVKAG